MWDLGELPQQKGKVILNSIKNDVKNVYVTDALL